VTTLYSRGRNAHCCSLDDFSCSHEPGLVARDRVVLQRLVREINNDELPVVKEHRQGLDSGKVGVKLDEGEPRPVPCRLVSLDLD
jgi:hypothetical protein